VKLPCGDAREFAQVTLRHGVVILPGPTMSAADQHASYLRLPFLAEPEILETGIRRLCAAWRDYQSSDRRERRQSLTLV
jgi:DNA-binding transcriptional MocR family regulator